MLKKKANIVEFFSTIHNAAKYSPLNDLNFYINSKVPFSLRYSEILF